MTTFKFPVRYSPSSVRLKKKINNCTRKDAFRSILLQSYINEDWENFARPFAIIELVIFFVFVMLITVQFWQTSLDEAMMGFYSPFLTIVIPFLTVTILVFNILKEIL